MTGWKAPAAALAVLAATVFVAGCGGPDITQSRVDDSVAPAFASLYARQQYLLGTPLSAPDQASAACLRNDKAVHSSGSGDDWVCQILLNVGAKPSSQFTYELNVKADGCYEADGPPSLVGGLTITTPGGSNRVNPLFAFDGCFDTW